MTKSHLEDVPLDDGSSGVFQSLLPVFEARLVFFVLAPAKLDLADGVSAANQIIIADLMFKYVNCNPVHGQGFTVMSRVTLFISISSMIKTKDSFQ